MCCQMFDGEFMECRRMVIDYLALYHRQPTKLPRLQLAWTISRRTLHKMKPSTKVSLDLEPIMEDEKDAANFGRDEDRAKLSTSDDDNCPFDMYVLIFIQGQFNSI